MAAGTTSGSHIEFLVALRQDWTSMQIWIDW